jgi:aryl-alcohol dehydrogenase-like predicted oxidoreductase
MDRSSGWQLSQFALGCEVLGGTDWGSVDLEAAAQTVRRAQECGVTVFDTADVYGLGRSEEMLADALGDRRTKVTICSKFGVAWRKRNAEERAITFRDCRPERVYEALDSSLRRLRLDCLPLYLMHWPDPAVSLDETMGALGRCYAQGKVLGVGVSNCSAEQIEQAHAVFPLSAVQVSVSLVNSQASAGAVEYCRQHGIPVMCYGPLAQGLLTGKYGPDIQFGHDDRRRRLPHFQREFLERTRSALDILHQTAVRHGKSVAQVALRWVLQYPGVSSVVAGARTPQQLEENLGAFGWSLNPDEWQSLRFGWTSLEDAFAIRTGATSRYANGILDQTAGVL